MRGHNRVVDEIKNGLKGIASAAAQGAMERASKEVEGHDEDLSARVADGAERVRNFFEGHTRAGKRARADVDVFVVEPRRR